MGNVRVRLLMKGVNRLMRSKAVQQQVNREGYRIAQRAGSGFTYVARPHKWTARGYVQASDAVAAEAEARDKVLTRAVK